MSLRTSTSGEPDEQSLPRSCIHTICYVLPKHAMDPHLPARRVVPLPAPSASGGTSGGRDLAISDLKETKYTHAEAPRAETCFLCRYVSQPADASDPLAEPEASIICRMRAYWDEHVNKMDFRYLAEDCARLFAKEYETCWVQPGTPLRGVSSGSDGVADADMVYRHFTVHEGTQQTRRAVMKRAYQQQFEFLEANKRNGYVEGKHGKRLPDRAAEGAHAKGCLVLLKMGAYLDKLDDVSK